MAGGGGKDKGNSSITNDFGTWRYFNSAVDKLGSTKGAGVSFGHKGLVTPEQSNWLDTIARGMKAFGGYWNGTNEIAKTKEKALRKQEEEFIHKANAEGKDGRKLWAEKLKQEGIPFQDDPKAMYFYNFNNAQVTRSLAKQSVMQDIQMGKCINLTEPEIDKLFYDKLQSAQEEVSDLYGFNPNGFGYQDGLYSGSLEDRLEILTTSKAVTEKEVQRQGAQTLLVNSISNIENSKLTSTEAFDLNEKQIGELWYQLGDEGRNSIREAYLKALKGSPRGASYMTDIRSKPSIIFDGKSLDEIYGKDVVDGFIQESANADFMNKTRIAQQYEDKCYNWAVEGNVVALRNELANEYKKKVPNEAKINIIQSNLRFAENQLKQDAKNAQAQALRAQVDVNVYQRMLDISRNKPVPTWNEFKKQHKGLGVTEEDYNAAVSDAVATIMADPNTTKEQKSLLMLSATAKDEGVTPEYKALSRMGNDLLQGLLDDVKDGALNGNGFIDITKRNPNDYVERVDKQGRKYYESKKALAFVEFFNTNPAAAFNLLGIKSPKERAQILAAVLAAQEGKSIVGELVKAELALQEIQKNNRKKNFNNIDRNFSNIGKNGEWYNWIPGLGRDDLNDVNARNIDFLTHYALARAYEFKLADPSLTGDEAYKLGQKEAEISIAQVADDLLMPSVKLMRSFGIKEFDKSKIEKAAYSVNDTLNEITATQRKAKKLGEEEPPVWMLNTEGDAITMFDPLGNILITFSTNQLLEKAKKRYVGI